MRVEHNERNGDVTIWLEGGEARVALRHQVDRSHLPDVDLAFDRQGRLVAITVDADNVPPGFLRRFANRIANPS